MTNTETLQACKCKLWWFCIVFCVAFHEWSVLLLELIGHTCEGGCGWCGEFALQMQPRWHLQVSAAQITLRSIDHTFILLVSTVSDWMSLNMQSLFPSLQQHTHFNSSAETVFICTLMTALSDKIHLKLYTKEGRVFGHPFKVEIIIYHIFLYEYLI